MNVNEMFPARYLKGSGLKAPVTVTIARVVSESMYTPGKGKVTGWVLYCEKATKGVVLHKTITNQIAAALSEPDTDNWAGKQVVLYPELVTVGREQVTAIRAEGRDEWQMS